MGLTGCPERSLNDRLPSHLTLLTYLLTPCSTALLEKLTGSQLVEKFLTFYGTQRFITAVTSAHHHHLTPS